MFYLVHILRALIELFNYFVKSVILGVPVSYPGDPIRNPQSRIGKWRNQSVKATKGWKFAEAEASHAVTDKEDPEFPLTGEPAGRQTWYFDPSELEDEDATFNAAENPNSGDKLFRNIRLKKWGDTQPDAAQKPANAREAVAKGMNFFQMLQCEDGHWAGDYGGPMFLMPGLICVLYVTGAPWPAGRREAMTEYLLNHQQADGGWGTHIECASTMFGTVLNYVALRLLGQAADAKHMVAARAFIHEHGGALYAPSWAKFWLACIGCFHWDGINSIPVEMWFLPRDFIFHPGKLWCHCRMVYLPMGYIYCARFTPPGLATDPVLQGLRKELFTQPYDSIDWDAYRQTCAAIDEYSPLNPVMKVAQDLLSVYEWLVKKSPFLQRFRAQGLAWSRDYIRAEDIQTNYIDIGPVNKALNMLAVWVSGGCDSKNPDFRRHLGRVADYLWVAEDGMKMQGYNGSQCWDTAFTVQAMLESGLLVHNQPQSQSQPVEPESQRLWTQTVRRAYSYFDRSQIKNDEVDREKWFRHVSKGGWPFSSAAHGWPISDCTAEGLKAVLAIHRWNNATGALSKDQLLTPDRLQSACDVLLSYQNPDGGWATYENNRGFGWYELLNPSEVFGDIMIDYSYVECSSASLTALLHFHSQDAAYRAEEVRESVRRGRVFLKSIQRADGSWYGSWGNCFTYGTWFGVEGLVAAGEALQTSDSLQRAVRFLLQRQNANGGWGENYLACVNKSYPKDGTGVHLGCEGSGVVQTAWALLALMRAGYTEDEQVLRRGVAFLLSRQQSSGDWDQEGITGVFNRSCGITYTAYRNCFPLWALARYTALYERRPDDLHT